METGALAAAQEMDFSLLALFARATLTVQAVMLMLLFASILALRDLLSTLTLDSRLIFSSAAPHSSTQRWRWGRPPLRSRAGTV